MALNAYIVNFRRGPKTQKNNELIIEIPRVHGKDEAAKFIGRKVILEAQSGKKFIGTVVSTHGRKGRLRVRFRKGIPGQLLGCPLKIL
ncbi:MAG: 50S ribosomal protein L35ae [Candidatus Hecatellaceae archaeon]